MSRGLGRVEHAVLDYLADRKPEWPSRLDVISHGVGHHPESIRRAMKTLAAKGFIEIGWDNGWRINPEDGQAWRFWDAAAPTARLSAEYLSTLTGQSAPGGGR